MLFRIYTERFDNLAALAAKRFDSFTVLDAVGYWQGQAEKSAVIEVSTDNRAIVRELAEDIKVTNHQQAVLITETAITQELI